MGLNKISRWDLHDGPRASKFWPELVEIKNFRLPSLLRVISPKSGGQPFQLRKPFQLSSMFNRFFCALFGFRARKFPAKPEKMGHFLLTKPSMWNLSMPNKGQHIFKYYWTWFNRSSQERMLIRFYYRGYMCLPLHWNYFAPSISSPPLKQTT